MWVSKTDLVYSCPDLASVIDTLTDADMELIANAVSDALQDTLVIALEQALLHHLGITDSDTH